VGLLIAAALPEGAAIRFDTLRLWLPGA
jgi:hypothetical protein